MVRVLKRNGSMEEFSSEKVRRSVAKAAEEVGVNAEVSPVVDRDVYSWEVADLVQLELLRGAIDRPELAEVAKAHLLGRIYKDVFGVARVEDYAGADFDRSLSYNALRLFTNGNYGLKSGGRLVETPAMAATRVAKAVGGERWGEYFRYITELKVVPASPFWFNAGTRREMFASCFTLEVEDCLSSLTHPGMQCIYDALAYSGVIQQLGGGVGYDFSLLRPEGDVVKGSVGVASGPVSFMRLFDANVEVIKQGGKRRGAQMGTLHVWHPEVRKFIKAKTGQLRDSHLQNFNISVFVEDSFMEKALAVDPDARYPLVNPRQYFEKTGRRATESLDLYREGGLEPWGWIDARELFREVVEGAWDSGDPGVIYKGNLNASNPLLGTEISVGSYKTRYVWRSVNPCAETVQTPFEVCNLTHINLARFVGDWEGLAEAARVGTRFLDDAIDRSKTGISIVDGMSLATRKNGLGVMGFAEMLIRLGIPYASWEAVELANKIMAWIYVHALEESIRLARERGPFKYFDRSIYARGELPVLRFQDHVWGRWEKIRQAYPPAVREAGDRLKEVTMATRRWLEPKLEELMDGVKRGVRNSVVLSIAPTGRTSILAGTTSGVEPVFALAFVRNVTVGTLVEYYMPGVEYLKARGLWTPEVRKAVEEGGMLKDAPVPPEVRHLLATAMEIGWLWHLLIQASAQQWVDQGISKTVNMPSNASVDDVYWTFATGWALGVKGVTVYRDKSKSVQVIYTGLRQEIKKRLYVRPLAELPEGATPYCKTGECG
ncbi:MAG: adenosylcobalamin-dependent ribonucleoside-diphosphate reductase [Pyrobaculum sp.]